MAFNDIYSLPIIGKTASSRQERNPLLELKPYLNLVKPLSLILSLIDSFLRARQMQQSRPRLYTSPAQRPQRAFHVDPYSFGSEDLHLWQDIQQRPFVPPSEERYSFGPESFSASATLRHRRKGPYSKVGPEFWESQPKEKYDFSASSRRPNLSETQPQILRELPEFDFGEGGSRRKAPIYLEPHMLPSAKPEIDFGMSGSRKAPEFAPRESFKEFMHGTLPKPKPQPTIKSSVNLRKTEKYDFGISY